MARPRKDQSRGNTQEAAPAEEVDSSIQEMIDLIESLGFSNEAAKALVIDQLIRDEETLLQLDDEQIENLCKMVRKPGGGGEGHQIPEMAVTRFQLLVYYVKHLDRTDRLWFMSIDADHITLHVLTSFKDQKKLEKDWLKQNPEHKLEAIHLDNNQAARSFDQAVTILRRIRGVTGVPLSYVVRHKLIPTHHADDPACGKVDSDYTTFDEELEARAPIIEEHNYYSDVTVEDLERSGPFHPAFRSDTKKVWATLHALFGTTSAWAHVKTLDKTQNGRQAFRILHKHFFGGNKVSMMATTVLSNLRNLTYTGDTKNYNFDKYVTNHVQQHNLAHSLEEYGAAPIAENYKIDYFLTGIKCADFHTANSVKDHFVEFRRMQSARTPAGTNRNVSSVGRGGGGRGSGGGRGNGGRDKGKAEKNGSADAHKAGLPSQAEVDKCTHIQAKRYPPDEYKNFNAAERQRHWQLMHPEKKPWTDSNKRKVAALNSGKKKDDESDDDASLFKDDDDDKKGGQEQPRQLCSQATEMTL